MMVNLKVTCSNILIGLLSSLNLNHLKCICKNWKGMQFFCTIPSELGSECLKLIKISVQSIFFHKRVRGDLGLSRRRTVHGKLIHIKIIVKTVYLIYF
jgi:hypothetical protein